MVMVDNSDTLSLSEGLSGKTSSLPGYSSRMSIVSEPPSSTTTATPTKDSGILAIIAGHSSGSKLISLLSLQI